MPERGALIMAKNPNRIEGPVRGMQNACVWYVLYINDKQVGGLFGSRRAASEYWEKYNKTKTNITQEEH